MSDFKTWRRFLRRGRLVVAALFAYVILGTVIRIIVPPPTAVAMMGEPRTVQNAVFLADHSWLDRNGQRHLSQTLFDQVFTSIEKAKKLILLDMFLFNDWQGPVPETHRALSEELTNALVTRKRDRPDIDIIVISDPINTVYGGMSSPHLERLRRAGIIVSLTDLTRLQDSNPLWSGVWRWLIRPFGNSEASTLANPFGAGRVSVRSYLTLLNFKANHRKLLIADDGIGSWRAVVSSANPHDGSSAHHNAALSFGGMAVHDLLMMERNLLEMNQSEDALNVLDKHDVVSEFHAVTADLQESTATLQVLGESRIHDAIVNAIANTDSGDTIDLAMFYLSERQIIKALTTAKQRGVFIRVLLDVNNDAFGRQKNGVPNRPVAAELHDAGIEVRWCATRGEQCHAKWLHVAAAGSHTFIMGSANFTRRNLLNLNLETNIQLVLQADDPLTVQMTDFFDVQWNNTPDRTYSLTYEDYATDSLWLTMQYRFMEATGLSTF